MCAREIRIDEHTYVLPRERIAQYPLAQRDASQLLVYRDGAITDRVFRDLPEVLPEGALLVMNDTRVVHARLHFRRNTGARIEVMCLGPANERPVEEAFAATGACEWSCIVGNAKRWKEGEELLIESGDLSLHARRSAPDRVMFHWTPATLTFSEVLARTGHVPLPPYMERGDERADKERYNTVFARQEGSVAAPTASLHFTPEVLAGLEARRITQARLTLHVGAGTFLPVKSATMAEHVMHSEQIRVPLAALEQLLEHLGRAPVIASGTTALRSLESIYWHGLRHMEGGADGTMAVEQWEPYAHGVDALPSPAMVVRHLVEHMRATGRERLTGTTRLLIAPGYPFRFADGLITNFHQPGSTLLLLVAAFIGEDWRKVYAHALSGDYRFLSYGDGSLLWRNTL